MTNSEETVPGWVILSPDGSTVQSADSEIAAEMVAVAGDDNGGNRSSASE